MIMLNFENVTKVFKSDLLGPPFVALKDVSFKIPTGAMVGFLGANGAGKTTSLKIIMDFIRADQGHVRYSPELGQNRMEVMKKIGFLPERPYFYPNLKGRDFLKFMGLLSEIPSRQIEIMIQKWAPVFKIDHALDREIRTYSKGMLQRVGFMATILHEPEFIILDEPLSGLDPIGRKELKDVIINLHRNGKTIFFSSHIVSDIEAICSRVIFLKEGRLVYDGEVEQLIQSGTGLSYEIRFKTQKQLIFETELVKLDSLYTGLAVATLKEDNKDRFIQELVSTGADIIHIEVLKPSLEEIFYNIKS
jgi:ABC-2 type transport system ATP-binding protein